MISYSPKTNQDGQFLGMILDDGGAWTPLSELEKIQSKHVKICRDVGCSCFAFLLAEDFHGELKLLGCSVDITTHDYRCPQALALAIQKSL